MDSAELHEPRDEDYYDFSPTEFDEDDGREMPELLDELKRKIDDRQEVFASLLKAVDDAANALGPARNCRFSRKMAAAMRRISASILITYRRSVTSLKKTSPKSICMLTQTVGTTWATCRGRHICSASTASGTSNSPTIWNGTDQMSERELQAGDEVWVKGEIEEVEYKLEVRLVKVKSLPTIIEGDEPWFDDDVRTEADFKTLLEQAIVDAAVALVRRIKDEFEGRASLWPETNALKDAVQAKLDADKPQTARERLQGVIFRNLPTNPRDPIEMPNVAMLDEAE